MLSIPSLMLATALAAAAPAHAAPDVTNAVLLHDTVAATPSPNRQTVFIHRTFTPERPSGRTIIMLHLSLIHI